jgi:hypothetical protein
MHTWGWQPYSCLGPLSTPVWAEVEPLYRAPHWERQAVRACSAIALAYSPGTGESPHTDGQAQPQTACSLMSQFLKVAVSVSIRVTTHPQQCKAPTELESFTLLGLAELSRQPPTDPGQWNVCGFPEIGMCRVLTSKSIQIQAVASFSEWLLATAPWAFSGRWCEIFFWSTANVQISGYLSSLWGLCNFLLARISSICTNSLPRLSQLSALTPAKGRSPIPWP